MEMSNYEIKSKFERNRGTTPAAAYKQVKVIAELNNRRPNEIIDILNEMGVEEVPKKRGAKDLTNARNAAKKKRVEEVLEKAPKDPQEIIHKAPTEKLIDEAEKKVEQASESKMESDAMKFEILDRIDTIECITYQVSALHDLMATTNGQASPESIRTASDMCATLTDEIKMELEKIKRRCLNESA